jgi:hypothetical protein
MESWSVIASAQDLREVSAAVEGHIRGFYAAAAGGR